MPHERERLAARLRISAGVMLASRDDVLSEVRRELRERYQERAILDAAAAKFREDWLRRIRWGEVKDG